MDVTYSSITNKKKIKNGTVKIWWKRAILNSPEVKTQLSFLLNPYAFVFPWPL